MKISEQLIAAKALISDPAHWLRDGNYCDSEDWEQPTCFCILGAIHKAVGNTLSAPYDTFASRYIRQVLPYGKGNYIADWNDNIATHQEVMDVFDKAIALAQKDESNEPK